MKTIQKMPNLTNYTAQGLVDVCAPDMEECNRLKKLTDYYKVGLKARLTDEMKIPGDPYTYLVEGEEYSATISDGGQERLDIDMVRALLTEEQIKLCTKFVSTQTVRFFKNPSKEDRDKVKAEADLKLLRKKA